MGEKKIHDGDLNILVGEKNGNCIDHKTGNKMGSSFTAGHDDIVDIEEARIPGNYSARKGQRWNASSIYATNIASSNDDAIHKNLPAHHISPAQMYSTESGKMFHAGSICIIMVGLPGRGKTNLSISLCRYLRWLGVRTELFHLGDYRRKHTDLNQETDLDFKKLMSKSYFSAGLDDPNLKDLKSKIKNELIDDIVNFFTNSNGQIAIYDAINGIKQERLQLVEFFKSKNIKCLFIESIVNNEKLLTDNIKDSVNSPDYQNWDKTEALSNFKHRIKENEMLYETLKLDNDKMTNLPFIKSFNFGEKISINHLKHDFLTTKIIFYLLNAKIKSHSVYFARCSLNKLNFKEDPAMTESGKEYINNIYKSLASDFKDNKIPDDLMVWTSTRLRTIQSSQIFKDIGCNVKHRPELTQLNPGAAEGLSDKDLMEKFPDDYLKHLENPYHHRYPRAESYHDLALKIEPLILEIEKLSNDILLIADETIIRIFYGYLMASNAKDIPLIEFPQNEIIKISYHTYDNRMERILVEGIDAD